MMKQEFSTWKWLEITINTLSKLEEERSSKIWRIWQNFNRKKSQSICFFVYKIFKNNDKYSFISIKFGTWIVQGDGVDIGTGANKRFSRGSKPIITIILF